MSRQDISILQTLSHDYSYIFGFITSHHLSHPAVHPVLITEVYRHSG